MPHTGNRLLDHLSAPLREQILRASRLVDLPARTKLVVPGEVPHSLHLLTGGVASIVVVLAQGGSLEVGMVGSEGLVGASTLLGSATIPSETFMQVGGSGLRVPIRVLRDLFEESAELRNAVLQYLQAQVTVTAQLTACNRLHEAERRLARWLLTASDLSRSDKLRLTQEFLAQMLGSQRTTVAVVAGGLQRSGAIHYSRGTVKILNRPALVAATCSCYSVTHKALSNLYLENGF